MFNTKKTQKYPTEASLVAVRPGNASFKRIALYCAIIGGIASLLGNISLLFLTGSPNVSSLIILGCWLTSIVIFFLRMAWGALLTSLLGGIILIEFLTTPYVLEHLANPNSPNGGLGVFVGDILVIICAVGLLAGSLAMAYNQSSLSQRTKSINH